LTRTKQERSFIRGAPRGNILIPRIGNEAPTVNANARLMTVADVIADMGISRSTWQKLVSQGRTPPSLKTGTVQRVRGEAFAAWLAGSEVKAPAVHG
jgi:predicted DNA-binding transcriptional regulator AlpA